MNPANDNGEDIRFLSVCSGIEAASVAFRPLGWKAVAFSEIEKFPSAVLAHHYPDVPNLGDFTAIDTTKLGRVDILCGGTPCQAFSVAGLRGGLNDARGNLTLSFVRLAHELADGNGLRNVIYENVPGLLSDRTNAFGCFLGALVGADDALPPPAGSRWPDQGMVAGPKGRAAWAILDAQYFGLAQRRRRVVVVADFGNGADPAAVLFELYGVQGNTPPRREARKDVAAYSASSIGSYREAAVGGAVRAAGGDNGGGSENLVAFAPEIARCDATREGSSQDYETTTMVAVDVAPTMRAGGNSTGGDRPYGTDVDTCDSLATVYSIMPQNSGKDYKARVVDVAQPIMAARPSSGSQGGDFIVEPVISIHADAIGRTGEATTPSADAEGRVRLRDPGMGILEDVTYNLTTGQPHAVCVTGETTHALTAEGHDASEDGSGRRAPIVSVFYTTQITSAANRSNPKAGDPCHPLSSQAHPPLAVIGFDPRATDVPVTGDITGVLDASYPGPAICFTAKDYGAEAQEEVSPTLRAGGFTGSHANGGVMPAVAFQTSQSGVRVGDVHATLDSNNGSRRHNGAVIGSAVRRLTPVECERLQGFKDGYTDIPWRGKPNSPDAPRYKALGNSWAVPMFVWLGKRVAAHMPQRVTTARTLDHKAAA